MPYADPTSPMSPSASGSSSALASPVITRSRRSSGSSTTVAAIPLLGRPITSSPSSPTHGRSPTLALRQLPSVDAQKRSYDVGRSRASSTSSGGTAEVYEPVFSQSSGAPDSLDDVMTTRWRRGAAGDEAPAPSFQLMMERNAALSFSGATRAGSGEATKAWAEKQLEPGMYSPVDPPNDEFDEEGSADSSETSTIAAMSVFGSAPQTSTAATSVETTPTASFTLPSNDIAKGTVTVPPPSVPHSPTPRRHAISPPSSRSHSRTTSPTPHSHFAHHRHSSSSKFGYFEVGGGVGVGMGGRGALPGLPRRTSSAGRSLASTPRADGMPTTSSWLNGASSSSPVSGIPAGSAPTSPTKETASTLGLKLGAHLAAQQARENRESISSSSTLESSGPETPRDGDLLHDSLRGLNIRAGAVDQRQMSAALDSNEDEAFPAHELGDLPKASTSTRIAITAGPHSDIPFPTTTSDSPPQPSSTPLSSPPAPALGKIFDQGPKPPVINPRHAPRSTGGVGIRRQPSSSLQLAIPRPPPEGGAWSNESPVEHHRPAWARKKSGELVKPSIKARSMSTPHLSEHGKRGTTKSEPPTPSVDGSEFGSERKNVRFGGQDDTNSKLEYVRHFQRNSRVIALSKEGEDKDTYTETETEGDTDYWSDSLSFRSRGESDERIAFAAYSTAVPRVRLDFTSYRTDEEKAKLQKENVVLERLDVPSEGAQLILRGTILVRNVAFQKWVAVRFTLDHWQTVSEVSALHVTHIPPRTTGDETGWDRFSFNIKLEDVKRKIEEKELLLCVRFSVHGSEWWDSNDGGNYRFGFRRVKQAARQNRLVGMTRKPMVKPGSPDFDVAEASGSTPPIPGVRPAAFGRQHQWNLTNSNSPRGSPTAGVFPSNPRNRSPPLPHAPDVHDHLKLETSYCAPPAPPLSPPKELDNKMSPPRGRQPSLAAVVGGQFATLAPPAVSKKGHERRRSWNGDSASGLSSAGWEETQDEDSVLGFATHTSASPSKNDLSMAARGGPNVVMDLFTPPQSNNSSPPNESATGLPMSSKDMIPQVPESPSTIDASASSQDTSLANSPHNEYSALPHVMIEGGESAQEDSSEQRHPAGYQELLDKYCFFQSFASEVQPPVVHQQPRPTLSGLSSSSSGGWAPSTDRLTPTGGRSYAMQENYFNFNPSSVYWGADKAVDWERPSPNPHASYPYTRTTPPGGTSFFSTVR